MGLLLGQVSKWRAQRADGGAHAARGFVGGATKGVFKMSTKIIVSMPHAALWVVQRSRIYLDEVVRIGFQCRTRLCGWCSSLRRRIATTAMCCFNAARGLAGGAAKWIRNLQQKSKSVSMPHAALWVVQPVLKEP